MGSVNAAAARIAAFGRTGPGIALLLLIFVGSRAWGVWSVYEPGRYGPSDTSIRRDVKLYHDHAEAVLDPGRRAYRNVDFEYPPGTLAVVALPGLGDPDPVDYRGRFVALMLLVDLAGLVGLVLLAQRWGSAAGIWMWALLVPLLGPLVYARADLVPAVLMIWALERAAAGKWVWCGALLGAGAAVKLYPALVIPAALFVAADRKRFSAAALAAALLPFAFFLPVLPDLIGDVFGYHTQRGIQIESIWGSGIFLAVRHGYSLVVDADFGAYHFNGGVVPYLKLIAAAATVAVVGLSCRFAARKVERGSAPGLAGVAFVVVASAVAIGTVFSPQFVIWVVGAGAAALCVRQTSVAPAAALVLVSAGLTQLIFPFVYQRLLSIEAIPLITLHARNLVALSAGVIGALLLVSRPGVAPQPAVADARADWDLRSLLAGLNRPLIPDKPAVTDPVEPE